MLSEEEEESLLHDVAMPIVVQLLLVVGLILVTALLHIAADNIVYQI